MNYLYEITPVGMPNTHDWVVSDMHLKRDVKSWYCDEISDLPENFIIRELTGKQIEDFEVLDIENWEDCEGKKKHPTIAKGLEVLNLNVNSTEIIATTEF